MEWVSLLHILNSFFSIHHLMPCAFAPPCLRVSVVNPLFCTVARTWTICLDALHGCSFDAKETLPMAEKSTTTKKKAPRQQMLETLAETEKIVTERRESQGRPEDKVEARAGAAAVAAADELAG